MITFLIEMLELPNFGHWPNIQYNLSLLLNFDGDVIDRNYDVITFTWKYIYFKKA